MSRTTGAVLLDYVFAAAPVRVAAGVLLIAFDFGNLDAQRSDANRGYSVSCPACRVQFDQLFRIGADSSSELLHTTTTIARDSRGRFYGVTLDRFALSVFDSTGKKLSTIGRRGEGPGEFSRSVRDVEIGPGDSLFVFEASNRVTVFAPNHVFARTILLPATPSLSFVFADGRILFTGRVGTRASIGFPLHLADRDGKLLRSFGPEAQQSGSGRGAVPLPALLVGGDEKSVWVPSFGRYRFEEWRLDGSAGDTIGFVRVPWWVQGDTIRENAAANALVGMTTPARSNAPRTSFIALSGTDQTGYSWIVGTGGASGRSDQAVATRLELVKLSEGTVLLTQEIAFTGGLQLIRRGAYAYSKERDPNGATVVTVWRYTVVGR